MLNYLDDVVLVAATVIASLGFMVALYRVWPCEKRSHANDLIGWQLSIVGTTYAVILGFMLYTVWTAFGEADLNVDLEANAVVNIYSLAAGLPEPQRGQMRTLARSYATTAVELDWPAMAAAKPPNSTEQINAAMWRTLMTVKSASPTEINAADHSLYELSALTEHRRTRVLQNASRLPPVLWWVLLVGGTLTIVSSCLFGSESIKLHGLQVFAFSLLISLCLIAIADINRPFQGEVHVGDLAFRRALLNMQAQ
ncbi:MAG TPA: DUF4239 domain-containing protein [Candidatus Bathyarchaeia archaeon]|nr:DUF4239 domain-containing protein [Candidatus Bathyarchaeia archaeon]